MKISRVYIVVLILVISCSKREGKRSEAKTDSLNVYLSMIENDSIKVSDRLTFNYKALKILRQSNDSILKEKLFIVANNFYTLDDQRGFYISSKVLLSNYRKMNDTLSIARSYVYLAEHFRTVNEKDSSYYYYLQAEKYYLKFKAFPSLADVLVRKADLQNSGNDFFASEKSALDALSLLRNTDNYKKIYEAYNLIGISSAELGNHQKAIEYFSKALDVTNKLETDIKYYFKAISLNNIGNEYQNLHDYSKAITFFKQALRENLQTSYPDLYATILDNIAYSSFKIGDNSELPKLFLQSLKIRLDLSSSSKIILSKIHLSEFYYSLNDIEKAKRFSAEALVLSRIEKFPSEILASLKQLSIVDPINYNSYSKEYILIKDSLQQRERRLKDRFARIQFETDEITIQKDKLEEQNRTLLYFFVAALMIGTLLFVIRMQRSKNRELLLIQGQQKANEDIYNLMIAQQSKLEEGRIAEKKRIAQELHDGVLGRLFGTRLNLDSLNRMSDDQAIVKRNNYLVELKNIEQDIREISHDLNREKYVLINNFVAILTNLLEEQKANFRPDVAVHIDEKIKWDEISNTLKINLYRIIQESLQNINKYAQANTINLKIEMLDGTLMTIIADDGVGFDVNVKKKGIGLQNILSRTQVLNGSFSITSSKDQGTCITITFPDIYKKT